MKKTLLALMLAAALPAHAQMDIQPEDGASLLIWTDRGAHTEFMEYAAGEFSREFNVPVTVNAVPPMDTIKRLIQDGGSAKVGDVVEFEHDLLGAALAAGVLMENLVSSDRIEAEFTQGAINAAKDAQGVMYGFPVMFNTKIMYYNKDLLPEGVATVEDMITFSQDFSNAEENKYGMLWDIQNFYDSRMFVSLFGGYEFGNNGTNPQDIGLASDFAVKGVQAMLELKPYVDANSADVRNPQVRRGLFAEGKVAALVDGPWALAGLQNSGVNLGMQAMPSFKGQELRTFQTVRLAGVSSFTEYPRAAQLFADFITTDEMAMKRHEMTNAVPPVRNVMNELSKSDNEFIRAMVMQGAQADAMPGIAEMGYVWQPMQAALSQIWDNGGDVKASLESAHNVIAQQIQMQSSK
uniref:extracellular solute-binding protein n=1 Tax=Thaumasiovibrio occultus TaxID=1891184 RepID=UPI000B355F9F|nr:extracellular solute-binding protein [Thaumasiovibrio occultus]